MNITVKNNIKNAIFKNRLNYVSLFIIVIGIATGLLITAQWRTKPRRVSDPIVSFSSLVQTKELLEEEQEKLKYKISKLNNEIILSQNMLKQFSDFKNKIEQVQDYENKIGLTDISGKGVVITLDDSSQGDITPQSITHAADLRDIVNLLWGLNAKAIDINGERIVYNTSIDCIVNTILINSTRTTPPFTISVIGNPEELEYQLNNKNNLSDIHERIHSEGLKFNVRVQDNIIIKAYTGSLKLEYINIYE
jgi:uncharacterized protein YlxW (UPF0749 family)